MCDNFGSGQATLARISCFDNAHNRQRPDMTDYNSFWELLGYVMIVVLVILGILAIIEPGPLRRRSRNRRGQRPANTDQEATQEPN